MDERDLPLSEHLTELRNRIIICLLPLLLFVAGGYVFAPNVLSWLLELLPGIPVYCFSITDPLIIRVRVGLILALVPELPIVVTEAALYLRPGLYPSERKRLGILAVIFSIGFLIGGFLFAFVLAPGLCRWWLTTLTDYPAYIDLSRLLSYWETGLLLCGLILAAAPLLTALIIRRKGHFNES